MRKKCILHFSKLLTVCAPSQMMTLSPVFKNLVNSPANLSFNDGSPTPQSSTYILALQVIQKTSSSLHNTYKLLHFQHVFLICSSQSPRAAYMYHRSKIDFVKEIKTSSKESTKRNQCIHAVGWFGPEQIRFQKKVPDQI